MQAFVWIMRHCHDQIDHPDRPLTPQGVQAAKAAGVALQRLKTPIQACLVSPIPRAFETATLTCQALKLTPEVEMALGGPPVDIRDLVKARGNCLVVSHSASLQTSVFTLTGAQMTFAKGTLAQVHEGELWTVLDPSVYLPMAGIKVTDPLKVDVRDSEVDARPRPTAWRV